MLKEFLLFIKYPYTAGVIATMWLGSAALLAIDEGLPLVRIVMINMIKIKYFDICPCCGSTDVQLMWQGGIQITHCNNCYQGG